jgi:hypothetical protein
MRTFGFASTIYNATIKRFLDKPPAARLLASYMVSFSSFIAMAFFAESIFFRPLLFLFVAPAVYAGRIKCPRCKVPIIYKRVSKIYPINIMTWGIPDECRTCGLDLLE